MERPTNRLARGHVIGTECSRKRSLARSGQHHGEGQSLTDSVAQTESREARGSEHDRRPVCVVVELFQTRVDISANIRQLEIRAGTQKLSAPPVTAGCDYGALGQCPPGKPLSRH